MSTPTSPTPISAEVLSEPAAAPKPAWVQFLEEELDGFRDDLSTDEEEDFASGKEEDFAFILMTLIGEYMFCEDPDAPVTFARRFDDLYAAVYEPRFNGYNGTHKGWTGYLKAFYESLFSLAMEIRYDDPLQEKVIQLLVELRKLPTHRVKVFVVSLLPLLRPFFFLISDSVTS